ncbi:Transcription factor tau 91 kDa subunit [Nakaseomyces bracarensis]|uniref:Transcription factor tau 91 kDa subunit n=1 Tax=Nakaseomyces bracarensis TaxID=273131 RepID=A0ABR4P0G9_9SACH
MTEDVPKKRGRGRPRKAADANSTNNGNGNAKTGSTMTDVTNDGDGIAAAALKELGESRKTRGRPKKKVDDDFVPGEVAEEVDDSVIDEELMRKPKRNKISTKSGEKKRVLSTLEQKGRIIRSLKDLSSARDKIERVYGLNRERLLELAKIKEGFEACLFDVSQEDIQSGSPYWLGTKKSCQLGTKGATDEKAAVEKLIAEHSPQFDELSEEQYQTLFKTNENPIDYVIGDTGFTLSAGQRAEFPVLPDYQRYGFVFNAGGLVTDMAWLAGLASNEQYLAVAVSQYRSTTADGNLRMFDQETHISCIQIYQIDPATLSLKKQFDILHPYGEIWDLRWHEGIEPNKSSLGVLFFASQSGNVKVLEIPDSIREKRVLCKGASLDLGITNSCITTYDFLSTGRLICGFKNGYVAEFDLSDTERYREPSFYSQVHSSYITTIVVAHSAYEADTVGTLSVDGYFYLFNPRNIFTTKTNVTRFRGGNMFPMVYLPQLYALVYADGANCLRSVVPRAAFSQQTMSSIETNVSSVASSILHPLILYGSSSGSLYVSNAARRLLTGTKNSAAAGRALKLWQWDFNPNTHSYRLDQNYKVDKLNGSEMTSMEIDAPGVNITCVKWNENPQTGKFYCFANAAGLVTIEKIGEKD